MDALYALQRLKARFIVSSVTRMWQRAVRALFHEESEKFNMYFKFFFFVEPQRHCQGSLSFFSVTKKSLYIRIHTRTRTYHYIYLQNGIVPT